MDSIIGGNTEDLPDFQIDSSDIPKLKLRSLHIENFRVFPNYDLTFDDNFDCFYGPNGCGKSTMLDIIQLIFSRLNGYDDYRLIQYLKKSLRLDKDQKQADDFLVQAQIENSEGDYEIVITKDGFQKDHPEKIKNLLYRICFYTRYDNELSTFNLPRSHWPVFKKLFEAVTGFEIEEQVDVFSESVDPVQAALLSKYVLGFLVKKPHETILYKNCSAGERKIIKSFSTLLGKEYTPQIILVDNLVMHVESSRHIHLVNVMQECFSESQIVSTTHSYRISKNYPRRNQMHDLRILTESKLIQDEPWRLTISDEIEDGLAKLEAMMQPTDKTCQYIDIGRGLLTSIRENNSKDIQNKVWSQVSDFLAVTEQLFVENVRKYAEID